MAVGTRVIDPLLRRIGAREDTGSLVSFLVAEHLLLPDTATRRDLSDEDLVLDVAATVGSPERLAALYLLARADAEATGPAAWTPWRATLVRELVAKVQHVLERGEMGVEQAGSWRHGPIASGSCSETRPPTNSIASSPGSLADTC